MTESVSPIPRKPAVWMNPKTWTFHLVTLAGFLVIDWLFNTPIDVLDAVLFLIGLQGFWAIERRLRGRGTEG